MSFVSLTKNEYFNKTKMCKYYLVGCKNNSCNFAHNRNELKPRNCLFGERCYRNNCDFYHEGDPIPTLDNLYEKAIEGVDFVTNKDINRDVIKEKKTNEGQHITKLEEHKKEENKKEEQNNTILKLEENKVPINLYEVLNDIDENDSKKLKIGLEMYVTKTQMNSILKHLKNIEVNNSLIYLE